MDKLRFSFVIPDKLAGLSWPEFVKPTADVIVYLQKHGITTLVNTTTSQYADANMNEKFNVVHEPMANMTAPTISQMDAILEVYLKLTDKDAMAVHCMHGLGRTGTVIACILGKTQNMTAAEAIQTVRQKRRGSIESEEQENFIYQYLGEKKA